MRDLLDLTHFRGRGYNDSEHTWARRKLNLAASFPEQVQKLANRYGSRWTRDQAEQRKLAEFLARGSRTRRYRFFVFGHTHQPEITRLTASREDRPVFYVNTGCWRQVVARPSGQEQQPFVATRVRAMFRVVPSGTAGAPWEYELVQECLAN